MPKLMALARRRTIGSMPSTGTPNTWLAVMAWMSSPRRKASFSAGISAMCAAGRRVDLLHQRVRIGALQLRQLAPLEHARRQVVTLRRQLLEHVGAGGVGAGLALLAGAQSHLVEQHVAQLLGRADVEGMAGEFVDLLLELGEALGEVARQAIELGAVDLHPRHLHRGNDRNERTIDGCVGR